MQSFLITRKVFAAAFALSIFLSLVTMWLLISQLSTGFWTGMLASIGLIFSKAYVEYMTSGSEKPLSHFLLLCGLLLGFKSLQREHDSRLVMDSLTVLMLTYLARPDLALLVAPFYALLVWKTYVNFRTSLWEIAHALTPLALWTLFALFYYGAPFPNTYYAKLGTQLPLAETCRQGIVHLLDSFSFDPITLTCVSIGILLAMCGSLKLKTLAAGMVSVPALHREHRRRLHVGALSHGSIAGGGGNLVAVGVVGGWNREHRVGAVPDGSTLVAGHYTVRAQLFLAGSSVERYRRRARFLFLGVMGSRLQRQIFSATRLDPAPLGGVNVCGLLGAAGLQAGPSIHFIDPCGLTDPCWQGYP